MQALKELHQSLSGLHTVAGMLLLSMLLHCSALLFGQEQARVLSFYPDQHTGFGQTWAITQLPTEQTLWVANSGGVLHFNGNDWQMLTLPNGQIPRAIATDSLERVYTGGFAEFGYFERGIRGSWQYTSLSKGLDVTSIQQEEIWHITVFDGGVLFQSFSRVYFYDYEQVVEIIPPGNIMFIRQANGQLLFPVLDKGIYKWEPGSSFRFLQETTELADARVVGILPAGQKDDLLIVTEEDGIWVYEGGTLSNWGTQLNGLLQQIKLNKVILLADGSIAVGSVLDGLFLFTSEGALLQHFNQQNGLLNNTVLALFEDHKSNLWVGMDQGINLLDRSTPLRVYTDQPQSIGAVYAAAIWENQLYVGTNQGLFQRDQEAERFRFVPGTQGQVWSLKPTSTGLLCGHNDGTFLLTGNGIAQISDITGGWQILEVPEHPELLLQCTYTGLVLFEKKAGRWRFRERVPGLWGPIRQIAWGGPQQLWAIHASKGIYEARFNTEMDSITQLQSFSEKDGLPTTFGLQMTVFPDTLLVYTDSMTLYWSEQARKFVPLDTFRSRAVEPGQRILSGVGSDWFLASKEYTAYFAAQAKPVWLPFVLARDFPYLTHLPDGQYLFGQNKGYALLPKAEKEPQAYVATPPVISSATITHEKTQESEYYEPPGMDQSEPIELSAHQNQIFFQFSTPSFTRSPRFRYRLIGTGKDWSDWERQSTKEFTFLRHGSYVFELQAEGSGATDRFAFSILPPWYLSSAAFVLYVLLGFALAYGLYRAHLYRLYLQNRRLTIERNRKLNQARIRAKNEQLKADVLRKSQELANMAFNLLKINESLQSVKSELDHAKRALGLPDSDPRIRKVHKKIDEYLTNDQDWAVFEHNFNEVHEGFFKQLKAQYPKLTPGDLRIAAYLRMNLTTKEIAPLLNISIRGVENKRYRLRHKLELDSDENLVTFLMGF